MNANKGDGIVLVWTDCGVGLGHRGPWLEIQKTHSSSTRFLPIVMDLKNSTINSILASDQDDEASTMLEPSTSNNGLAQTL